MNLGHGEAGISVLVQCYMECNNFFSHRYKVLYGIQQEQVN